MLKTIAAFAFAAAAAATMATSASAAEVGTRWSTGTSSRSHTNGFTQTDTYEHGSVSSRNSGLTVDLAADDFRIDGIGGGGLTIDTDGIRGDSDLAGGFGGDDLRVDGLLNLQAEVYQGRQNSDYGVTSTERSNFTGSQRSSFGESSTFAR